MSANQIPEQLSPLPARIIDIMDPRVQASSESLAIIETGGSWTYGQLSTAIGRTQIWLAELGVRPGDRVMVVCENSRATVAIFLALGAMNAWPVLVNARLSPKEIDEIRDHSGARRLIYTTAVSVHARKHALRHNAAVETISDLGLLGIRAVERRRSTGTYRDRRF